MEPEGFLPYSQEPANYKALFTFRNWLFFFLRRGVVSQSPNPQAGGPPLSAVRDAYSCCVQLQLRSVTQERFANRENRFTLLQQVNGLTSFCKQTYSENMLQIHLNRHGCWSSEQVNSAYMNSCPNTRYNATQGQLLWHAKSELMSSIQPGNYWVS
jgi:hypothetical protein